jgi:hypothetical protein
VAEGAPLLREYVGKTCIEGSNPSDSAKPRPSNLLKRVSVAPRASQHAGLFSWRVSKAACAGGRKPPARVNETRVRG